MKEEPRNRLLLPYLDSSSAGVHLKISLVAEDPASIERAPFPFWVLDDSDPLTRILRASFLTETGSEIKSVLLFLQKDRYTLREDSLWPVHNQEVEAAWRKAFSLYGRDDLEDSLIVLGHQLDDKGELAPFGSLFYCKTHQTFFSPPCPYCGRPLEQCYNDDLLQQVGLPPYSTSLSRYLFCPSCWVSQRQPHFYTYELEGGEPGFVKDWQGLVEDFGRLLEHPTLGKGFLCGNCSNPEACYGTQGRAASKVSPFAFYPFFMLIFEDMPLKAAEFLRLVSGASVEDLKAWLRERGELRRLKHLESAPDRLSDRTLFFFEGGNQHFLEILYLKLTFLAELSQLILSELKGPGHPDMRSTLDQTWVKVGDRASLLPQLWSFRVQVIDIARNLPERALPPGGLPTEATHFLGLAWFYTLLSNKKQDTSSIYQSLKEALGRASPEEPLYSAGISEEPFSPGNLFWNPDDKIIDESWHPMWEEALLLGDGLLRASSTVDSGWSRESFWQKLVDLRDRIKAQLFTDHAIAQRQERPSEDEVLQGILANLMEKWESRPYPDERVLEETVVLQPKGPPDGRGISDVGKEAALKETVIISSEQVDKQGGPISREPEQPDLEETVVISPESRGKEGSIPLQEKDEEPVLETVILSPKQEPAKPFQEPSPGVASGEEGESREISSLETQDGKEGIGQRKQKKEEDFLSETVFISPRDRREHDLDKKK